MTPMAYLTKGYPNLGQSEPMANQHCVALPRVANDNDTVDDSVIAGADGVGGQLSRPSIRGPSVCLNLSGMTFLAAADWLLVRIYCRIAALTNQSMIVFITFRIC